VAALSLSAPEARMTRPTRLDAIAALRNAAVALSRRLGFRGTAAAPAGMPAPGRGARDAGS
jgi:hypothetical protein